jgi:predicted  nucleic acid-binding Zn-ribbon protein
MSASSVSGTKRGPSRLPVAGPGRSTGAEVRGAAAIAALVQLAETDLGQGSAQRQERPAARQALVTRLSHELREGYERALLTGRQPPVVPLLRSACSGCHVRLPTTLEQRIRLVRGVAACPRCLRLVYDPDWLNPRDEGRGER